MSLIDIRSAPLLLLLALSNLMMIAANILPLPYTNTHINQDLYDKLAVSAHIMDIAYCISPVSRIRPPFECDNGCEDFNNTEVLYQWTTNDIDLAHTDSFVTSGYLALNHDWKSILVVLRGTRSFKDSIVDISADMINLPNPHCLNCKVHKGFYRSYISTWNKISDILNLEMTKREDFDVRVMGHSLGGAVSVLLALKISQILHDPQRVMCITMGQPKIGNEFFSSYVDQVFDIQGSNSPFNDPRLLRVTHKNDPVVKLPWTDELLITDRYVHSSNEIFIDEVGSQLPSLENVIYCYGNNDMKCSSGMGFAKDNSEHLNYFRTMGKCGLGLS